MTEANTYKLLNIVLIESQFKREPIINFSDPNFKNDFDIQLDNQRTGKDLLINVTLHFKSGIGENEEIKATISMIGIFEIAEGTIIPDDFAKINGPAIIYPFIREHLASLSYKAGINPILLPPLNFVKLAEQEEVN